jgi:hypothetical protein
MDFYNERDGILNMHDICFFQKFDRHYKTWSPSMLLELKDKLYKRYYERREKLEKFILDEVFKEIEPNKHGEYILFSENEKNELSHNILKKYGDSYSIIYKSYNPKTREENLEYSIMTSEEKRIILGNEYERLNRLSSLKFIHCVENHFEDIVTAMLDKYNNDNKISFPSILNIGKHKFIIEKKTMYSSIEITQCYDELNISQITDS